MKKWIITGFLFTVAAFMACTKNENVPNTSGSDAGTHTPSTANPANTGGDASTGSQNDAAGIRNHSAPGATGTTGSTVAPGTTGSGGSGTTGTTTAPSSAPTPGK